VLGFLALWKREVLQGVRRLGLGLGRDGGSGAGLALALVFVLLKGVRFG
jgi:hypothetical protein